MQQIIVAAADKHGRFVAFNTTSVAAQAAGVQPGDILGKQLWDFSESKAQAEIKSHFSKCLLDGTRADYDVTSVIGGRAETWRVQLLPAPGADVIAISHEVQPVTAELTSEEIHLVELLASDHTINEIATELAIPESTAGSRVKRLRHKCGVRTNHGLVAQCGREGLIH